MRVQCCTIPNIVKCLFDEINILNSSSIYSSWVCYFQLGMLLPPGLAAPPVEGLQLSQSPSKQVAPAHHPFNFRKFRHKIALKGS
jgi:hypothetical protein